MVRILAGEPYFHIVRYILLLHVNLLTFPEPFSLYKIGKGPGNEVAKDNFTFIFIERKQSYEDKMHLPFLILFLGKFPLLTWPSLL